MSEEKKPAFKKIQAWFEDRMGLGAVFGFLTKKEIPLHKHTIWYYTGSAILLLFVIQIVTGFMLALYYRPTLEGANASIADGQGLGTITDDDPTPTVGFSSGSYSEDEDAGGATITVTLSAQSGRIVTVDYATSDGTATADDDYKAVIDTLTFMPGDTSQTFAVPIINDGLDETDETVNLTLSAATNANGTPTNATLTILDDDVGQAPTSAVYLPLIMGSGGGPQCGPDSYEPNDSCGQAYGPLASGQTYQSWISNCDLDTFKKSDYFYIDISTTNAINIYLFNIPADTDYDLYLYRNPGDDPNNPADESKKLGNSPETISYTPPATGSYYIRVHAYSGFSISPYSLRVTYD